MGVKIIKKLLTAIGNPILNNELKNIEEINVVNNDIQYQEGIFENLEKDSNIDFIILSQLIPGNLKLKELIEKIQIINKKIKIILILESYDSENEQILMEKGVYRIIYDNKIEIKDIIKIINEDEKMEKYNEEIRREINELKEYIKNNNINNKIKNNKKIINLKINNKNNKINNKKIFIKLNKKIIMIKNKLIRKILNNIIINKCKKNKNKFFNNIFNNNKKNNNIKINNRSYLKIINKNNFKNEVLINKNNRIISILGNNGSGKSIVSIMLSKALKRNNKKILIIDFDVLNNSLHTLLGVKKYSEKIKNKLNNNFKDLKIEDLIIKINKNIDLVSSINLIFKNNKKIEENELKNIFLEFLKIYDFIIVDTTSECFFEYTKEIMKLSDLCYFITEANLSEISKSKRYLEFYSLWNINNKKIKILFNKYNNNCIDLKLLKKLYLDYEIVGCLKYENIYNLIINNNFKNIFINNRLLNKYKKIKI